MLVFNDTSRANTVYQALKNKILFFEIQSGQSLTEEALAKEFSVSRTPIREALHMLEKDQLVETIRNKGAIVKGISERDVSKIFDLRIALEGWAAGEAAVAISDINLQVIETRLSLAKKKLEEGSLEEADAISNELHDIIAYVVDNKWFTKIISDLSCYTAAYKKLASKQPGQLEKAHREHEMILAALKKHDSEQAKERMVIHISQTKQSILQALRDRPYSVIK